MLPELPAGQLPPIDHGTVAAMPLPTSPPEPCTAGSAMAVVAACVQQLSEFAGDGRSGMGEDEQRAALALLAQAVLQLASRTLQMPATLAALNLQLGRAMGEWPRFGKKLMGLLPVASAAVAWPSSLLTLLPALRITSLEQLLTIAEEDLGNSERGSAAAAAASEVGFLSACEVAEGAAVAACSAALATADAASRPATWHLLAPQLGGSSSQQLMLHLLTAAPLLMDIAAAQQSVPLMLVPLAALWAASRQLAVQQRQDLAEAPPGVLALLGSLVTVMCCNPVELVRSCTHEALQAVLYSLAPPARMGALQHLLQVGTGFGVRASCSLPGRVAALGAIEVGLSASEERKANRSECLRREVGQAPILHAGGVSGKRAAIGTSQCCAQHACLLRRCQRALRPWCRCSACGRRWRHPVALMDRQVVSSSPQPLFKPRWSGWSAAAQAAGRQRRTSCFGQMPWQPPSACCASYCCGRQHAPWACSTQGPCAAFWRRTCSPCRLAWAAYWRRTMWRAWAS